MGEAVIELRPNCSHPIRHSVDSKYRMTVNEANTHVYQAHYHSSQHTSRLKNSVPKDAAVHGVLCSFTSGLFQSFSPGS